MQFSTLKKTKCTVKTRFFPKKNQDLFAIDHELAVSFLGLAVLDFNFFDDSSDFSFTAFDTTLDLAYMDIFGGSKDSNVGGYDGL